MKAVIEELWDTGVEIITTAIDENEITSFSDLRKCENVIVEKAEKGNPYRLILIDDEIVEGHFRIVSHPAGCGKLRVFQIF